MIGMMGRIMTQWAISPWETRNLGILDRGDDQELLWNCGQLCIMSFIDLVSSALVLRITWMLPNFYVGTSKTSETAKLFSPSPLLDTWDDRNPSWWSLQNEQLSSLGCFRFATGDTKSDVPESEILWSLLPSASLANSQVVSHCTILGNGGTRRICASVLACMYNTSRSAGALMEPCCQICRPRKAKLIRNKSCPKEKHTRTSVYHIISCLFAVYMCNFQKFHFIYLRIYKLCKLLV